MGPMAAIVGGSRGVAGSVGAMGRAAVGKWEKERRLQQVSNTCAESTKKKNGM